MPLLQGPWGQGLRGLMEQAGGLGWLGLAAAAAGGVLLLWAWAVWRLARNRPSTISQGGPLYGLALLLGLTGLLFLLGPIPPESPLRPLVQGGQALVGILGLVMLVGMLRLLRELDEAPELEGLMAENRSLRRESDSYRERLEALEKEYHNLAIQRDEAQWEHDRLLRELRAKDAELARERIRDEVTGLFTPDHFLLRMQEEFERDLRRGRMPVPLFMGLQGLEALTEEERERVLRRMGTILMDTLRQPDLASRFSDAELVVVPSDTDEDGALLVARRIHQAVTKAFNGNMGGRAGEVGVTFALVTYEVTFQDYQDFVNACERVRSQLPHQAPGKLVRYSSGSAQQATPD
jgi:GGDEF domain-containing protein